MSSSPQRTGTPSTTWPMCAPCHVLILSLALAYAPPPSLSVALRGVRSRLRSHALERLSSALTLPCAMGPCAGVRGLPGRGCVPSVCRDGQDELERSQGRPGQPPPKPSHTISLTPILAFLKPSLEAHSKPSLTLSKPSLALSKPDPEPDLRSGPHAVIPRGRCSSSRSRAWAHRLRRARYSTTSTLLDARCPLLPATCSLPPAPCSLPPAPLLLKYIDAAGCKVPTTRSSLLALSC